MSTPRITTTALGSLAAKLRGGITTSADLGWDTARSVWNGMIDRHPALVVHAGDVADIPVALDFAAAHDLPLALRSGGHNVAGHGTSDGGLVLDLRACNGVTVDPERRRATAGPGTLLGELDAACFAHGLAVPLGVVSKTGVAGLTLGGGLGWLTRAHGLSADNLLSAEMFTPAGEFVRADGASNPELLWGLRGGGAISGWLPPSPSRHTRSRLRCSAGTSSTPRLRPAARWQRCAMSPPGCRRR